MPVSRTDNVGYFSPFVPPEWIAAYGLRPVWLTLDRTAAHTHDAAHRGICPWAGALIANAMCAATRSSVARSMSANRRDALATAGLSFGAPASWAARGSIKALVLTTICDHMRYAAAYLDMRGEIPIFLLNVPSTWQSPQVRRLYREELERLGRFLVQIGGFEPTRRQLALTIEDYGDRRTAALEARPGMSATRWAETLVNLRSDPELVLELVERPGRSGRPAHDFGDGIPLALMGGPLFAEDASLAERVERAGGRIAVDASEGGERTLPARVDHRHLKDDPLDELVRIYFDTIPDVFRRPNTRLYDWLDKHLPANSVRGIILRRYPFCDLWHAELDRLRQWSDVPVLDVDVAAGDKGESSRTLGRIEAFLETLQ